MRSLKPLALLVVLFTLAVGIAPARAGEGLNELSLAGQFVKVDEGDDQWTLNVAQTFAVGEEGYFLIGPEFGIGEVDELNRLGFRADWNAFGTGPFTFYLSGSGLWFVKDRDEGPQHSALARGGLKIAVGKGAAIDVSMGRVVDGIGQEETAQIVTAGIIARWGGR